MSKKFYRFYGGLMGFQERWLNRMAAKGWRLIRTGKMSYEFEEKYYKTLCYPMLFGFLFWGVFALIMRVWWVGIFSALFLFFLIFHQIEIIKLAKQAKFTE